MKLIADSGSTKTDWYLIKDKGLLRYNTQGYNPYYFTTEEVKKSLETELLTKIDAKLIQSVYFYGSGCANVLTQKVIRDALEPSFVNASIHLGDDLLAAARATAGHEAGICCILGTGSNSCIYDGKEIEDKIPSLGYILGDEGAGAFLGRQLVSAYFYREMPLDLAEKMKKAYDMDKHLIISSLLNEKNPNRILASYALFASDHQEYPFVQELVIACFDAFINRHILKYPNAQELPIHFIGSIAFGFQDLLKQALEKHQLKVGEIYKSPFPTLLEY
jgi:N-acetylglucosamine kinase-like BadF-type ATPase